jgi:hypothetical protein
MAELGDERIDLLKIDIEGSAYELLPTLDLRAFQASSSRLPTGCL